MSSGQAPPDPNGGSYFPIAEPRESNSPGQQSQHSPLNANARKDSPGSLHVRSCVTCRRRKVKCDKQDPCAHCVRGKTECIYPAAGRAPRKPRQTSGKQVGDREAELLKRLRRLEGVVEELSGQVELGSVRQSPASDQLSPSRDASVMDQSGLRPHNVRVVGMDEGTKKDWLAKQFRIGIGPPKTYFSVENAAQGIGKLILTAGKSNYTESPFWASITEEMSEIKELMEEHEKDSDSDTPIVPSATFTMPHHQGFLMGYSSTDVDLEPLHPPLEQISLYWQTFLLNVHPMTVLIHGPTVGKTIQEVQRDVSNLSPSTEALMFSIYFATITSMSAEEVVEAFAAEKDTLLKQYRFGCEQALARAGFLNTEEIVTIQAFVMFLICVRRHDDTRFVWSLTGLALRLAQALGLHRDGSRLNLTPFDTEMRRRLWYQILILDLRAAEDHGSDPSVADFAFDTEYPINVNEEDISPEDEKLPVAREGATDMTFSLLRCEICSLVKKLISAPISPYDNKGRPALTLEEKELLIKETSFRLEDKYLKYCENAGPLLWVAASVARLVLAKMNLLIYYPLTQPGKPITLPQDLRDRLLISSVEICEFSKVLEDETMMKKWGWVHQTYVHWHAIAYILGELAVRENSPLVQRAWSSIHIIFNPWGGAAVVQKKDGMLWQPLRALMAKAKKKREENRRKESITPERSSRIGTFDHSLLANYPGDFSNQSSHKQNLSIENSNYSTMDPQQFSSMYASAGTTSMAPPQMGNVGTFIPDQVMSYNDKTFIDSNLLDIDMTSLENTDINWNGWDDMVRGFQVENENNTRDNEMGRGLTMGGVGNWW